MNTGSMYIGVPVVLSSRPRTSLPVTGCHLGLSANIMSFVIDFVLEINKNLWKVAYNLFKCKIGCSRCSLKNENLCVYPTEN